MSGGQVLSYITNALGFQIISAIQALLLDSENCCYPACWFMPSQLLLPCREVFGGQAGPVNDTTQTELQALFDIIGTPHWADVEALQSPAWKKYLQRLPGKAPTLYR